MNTEKMETSLQPVIQALHEKKNCIFIGSGGCGKTLSIQYLAAHFETEKKRIALTAATGIAAIGLSIAGCKGRTLHSWAGVGLARENADKLAASIMRNKASPDSHTFLNAHDRWLKTDLLFVDEISMIGKIFLEKLDMIGRIVRGKPDVPFGGIQLLFSGDWMQLPPVNDDWAFSYGRWDEFRFRSFIFATPLRFQKNRLEKDDTYFQLLGRFREGIVVETDCAILRERIKAYDTYLQTPLTLSDVKPTVLYPLKIEVWRYNKIELDKLPTQLYKIAARDDYTSLNRRWPLTLQQMKDRFESYLNEMIPSYVELKVGAQVMLKKNLDFQRKLVNGSRGVVTNIILKKDIPTAAVTSTSLIPVIDPYEMYKDEDPVVVEVKFLNGVEERISFVSFEYRNDDVAAARTTFPLVLAWCLTVHSSQGSTIDYAICDLGPQNFAYGQAYVGLSRVKNLNGLLICNFVESAVKVDPMSLQMTKKMEETGTFITFPSDLFL